MQQNTHEQRSLETKNWHMQFENIERYGSTGSEMKPFLVKLYSTVNCRTCFFFLPCAREVGASDVQCGHRECVWDVRGSGAWVGVHVIAQQDISEHNIPRKSYARKGNRIRAWNKWEGHCVCRWLMPAISDVTLATDIGKDQAQKAYLPAYHLQRPEVWSVPAFAFFETCSDMVSG